MLRAFWAPPAFFGLCGNPVPLSRKPKARGAACVRRRRRSRGSRELGFLSIALSFISLVLWALMYSPDDVSFFEPMVIEIAALSCAILAVQRGSKMWVLAIVGSLLLWSFVLYEVVQAQN